MGRMAYENWGQEDKGAFFPIFPEIQYIQQRKEKKESLTLRSLCSTGQLRIQM